MKSKDLGIGGIFFPESFLEVFLQNVHHAGAISLIKAVVILQPPNIGHQKSGMQIFSLF